MEETKAIYHIDDEITPYLVKIPLPSSQVTLKDFKMVLNKQNCNYKYFFKSVDSDFGVVKEEIADDLTILPIFNERIVSWLVSADNSNQSDACSEMLESDTDNRMTENHHRRTHQDVNPNLINIPNLLSYQATSVLSSDIDSTSLCDTESEVTLDRDMTECSSVHRLQVRKKPQRRKKRAPSMSRTSSYSSITDSTMSLNIITVQINMDSVNFLGISIVGQSNRGGDGGIYVGSIMKGGAVAIDGRIEPGDMILQVNDINFENMTNDEAVHVLREVVQKPGPIKLVVAKCWDPNPKGYFTIPRTEPVRPIDPGAWVAHTQALRSHETVSTDIPDLDFRERLHINMDMKIIVKAMTKPDSGLEIRDRMWLKITIPNAFIGADVVNWVLENVDGVSDRREARKYVSTMLRRGYIKHTVNKLTFSEQCYYVIGNGVEQDLATISLSDTESIISDITPLPNPPVYMPYTGTYIPSHGYQPIQYGCAERPVSSGNVFFN